MKGLKNITTVTLLTVLALACKESTSNPTAPKGKEPIVIKEVKFPDGKTTKPAQTAAKPTQKKTTPPPAKVANNESVGATDDQATRDAHFAQQTVRDNSVRDLRRQLMSECLMGVKARPMLRFTVAKTGEITNHAWLQKADQNVELQLPKDQQACLDAIISKKSMGPLNVKRANRKVQESITITIPL